MHMGLNKLLGIQFDCRLFHIFGCIILTAVILCSFAAPGQAESAEENGSKQENEPLDWMVSPPFEMNELKQFQIPVPDSWNVRKNWLGNRMRCTDPEGNYVFQAFVTEVKGVFFAPETREGLYSDLLNQLEAEFYHPITIGESEMGVIFPADVETEEGEIQKDHRLRLAYGFGTHLLMLDLISWNDPLKPQAMEAMYPEISYTPGKEEATLEDYQLTVVSLENRNAFSAGRKTRFQAAFANPETVNVNHQNDGVDWHLMAREEGLDDLISLNEYGILDVSENLDRPADVAVIAVSQAAGTQNYLEVRLLPKVRQLMMEKNEYTLYLGQEETAELQVSVEPETASRELEWVTSDGGVAAVEQGENGKTTVKAVGPGTARITAREPFSGEIVYAQVRVIRPVTELTVWGPTELKRGRIAYYHPEIKPENASSKALRWSLNVDSDVAEIDREGCLRIRRTAVPGTRILITCEAAVGKETLKAEAEVVVTE